MNQKTILTNLATLIGKADQHSDFTIARTMVRFSDLDNSSKIKLLTLIAKKSIRKGH
jgi:hypothetical protein